MSIYDEIRLNKRNYTPSRSATWMMNNVRMFGLNYPITPSKMLENGLTMQTTRISLGNMYMFYYSAKHKATLPYYDKFPLVIPISAHGNYFTGLNLHYLAPRTRLILLDKLLPTVTDDKLSPNAKFSATWSLLSRASQYPEVAPCIKMYHVGYVKSAYLKVDPKDWAMAIFLPVERFTVNNNQVWDESKKRIAR